MGSMKMQWQWRVQRRHLEVELLNSKSHFLSSRPIISKIFFYQSLKLVPLSNLKKFRLLTLITAPRRAPGSWVPNGHFSVHLGLNRSVNNFFSGQERFNPTLTSHGIKVTSMYVVVNLQSDKPCFVILPGEYRTDRRTHVFWIKLQLKVKFSLLSKILSRQKLT